MEKIQKLRGYWKFRERIGEEELIKLAQEWAEDPNYEELHIRNTSKDQLGIGFVYKNPAGDSKEDIGKYVDETSDMLHRRYGNDPVGWDISHYYYQIK